MAFTPLNALTGFLAVARHRNFAAAAAELRISPSALSQSVRQLESRLGVPLLTRTTRSVALTETGRRLFEHAGPGIHQALEALKAASARVGEVTGTVRLTVPEIAVPFVITPVLPRFLARYPQVEVDVQVESRRADIVSEGFDAGIRLEEALERDMVRVRLTEAFRFVVVGAPSYLERRGTPEKPEDLLKHECIGYRTPAGTLFSWDLERGRKSWRVPVRGKVTTNDPTVMLALAVAGVGLLYFTEPQVMPRLTRGDLRLVLEPYAAWVPGLFLYFPHRAQISPAFRAFLDTAREVMGELGTKGLSAEGGAVFEGEGWSKGVEKGRWRERRGLCAGPEQRRCRASGHAPAQAAHPGGRQQGRGLANDCGCLGLNTPRGSTAPSRQAPNCGHFWSLPAGRRRGRRRGPRRWPQG